MPHGTKIATCCYCGTRAALTLQGKVRHELACSSCGAPLNELKQIPVSQLNSAKRSKPTTVKSPSQHSWNAKSQKRDEKQYSSKKKKKKKSVFWEFAKDVIEEIFD